MRLLTAKLPQLRMAELNPSGDGTPPHVCRKIPVGMKYMFATQCSNPMATNAIIGKNN